MNNVAMEYTMLGKKPKNKEQKVNVTFSLPRDVNVLLHTRVERRMLSQFVSNAIKKALDEERESLRAAYAQANNDPSRNEVIRDWDAIESEGWND